jgi:hypothetical protein
VHGDPRGPWWVGGLEAKKGPGPDLLPGIRIRIRYCLETGSAEEARELFGTSMYWVGKALNSELEPARWPRWIHSIESMCGCVHGRTWSAL